jgi:hypothetical protein
MRRFRFHIGTLVILVLVLGVSLAALRESNEIWDNGIFTMTLVILLISSCSPSIEPTSDGRSGWASRYAGWHTWGCPWSRRLNRVQPV